MKDILHKKWVRVMIIIILIFSVAQFIRPRISNPPVTADVILPDSIKQILRKACYDCHSNETKLSWFDKITPANWLVAHDIREARKVLNFSEWDKLTKGRQKGILFESLNHIQFKAMPLNQYTFMHPKTKMGATEINLLQSYLTTLLITQSIDTSKTNRWNEQYFKWIQGRTASRDIKLSPNGIAFMAGYKDWVAISSTDRLDDGMLRVIMGNDIAVKAIKANHINPWPDGSAFAKIAWAQVIDSSGNGHTGEFKQVAFMIKDKNKYSSTDGWGFAQWEKGAELLPYGENIFFAKGCANCHKPMKENDFVFTIPLNLKTEQGLEDKLICSFVNKKQGTMTTLYGNKAAASFARTHTGNDYPAGSVLTMVTWIQKEDIHWFGAKIPDDIKSIEKIKFSDTGGTAASPVYIKYEGSALIQAEVKKSEDVKELHFILTLRASVMP